MKAITLRNLPADLATFIENEASRDGLSLNRTVIRILEKGAGIRDRDRNRVEHRDLDHLCGVWSDAEADAFDEALIEQRRIDPEVWK